MEATRSCCAPGCTRDAIDALHTPLCQKHAIGIWRAMNDEIAEAVGTPGNWLVTPEQAQAMLPRLNPRTLAVWVFRGRLVPAERTKSGHPLYWLSDIEDLLDAGRGTVERPAVVYYARMLTGRIKIGYTTDLYSRAAALRISHDAVLAFEPGGRDVELQRHRQFAATRHGRTEEFDESPDLLGHMMRVRREHGAPVFVARPRASRPA